MLPKFESLLPTQNEENEIVSCMERYRNTTLDLYRTYIQSFCTGNIQTLNDCTLPLSSQEYKYLPPNMEPEEDSELTQELNSCRNRNYSQSSFYSMSGNVDQYTSVDSLTETVRHSVIMDHSLIPDAEYDQALDSFLIDFYQHGEYSMLVKENNFLNTKQAETSISNFNKIIKKLLNMYIDKHDRDQCPIYKHLSSIKHRLTSYFYENENEQQQFANNLISAYNRNMMTEEYRIPFEINFEISQEEAIQTIKEIRQTLINNQEDYKLAIRDLDIILTKINRLPFRFEKEKYINIVSLLKQYNEKARELRESMIKVTITPYNKEDLLKKIKNIRCSTSMEPLRQDLLERFKQLPFTSVIVNYVVKNPVNGVRSIMALTAHLRKTVTKCNEILEAIQIDQLDCDEFEIDFNNKKQSILDEIESVISDCNTRSTLCHLLSYTQASDDVDEAVEQLSLCVEILECISDSIKGIHWAKALDVFNELESKRQQYNGNRQVQVRRVQHQVVNLDKLQAQRQIRIQQEDAESKERSKLKLLELERKREQRRIQEEQERQQKLALIEQRRLKREQERIEEKQRELDTKAGANRKLMELENRMRERERTQEEQKREEARKQEEKKQEQEARQSKRMENGGRHQRGKAYPQFDRNPKREAQPYTNSRYDVKNETNWRSKDTSSRDRDFGSFFNNSRNQNLDNQQYSPRGRGAYNNSRGRGRGANTVQYIPIIPQQPINQQVPTTQENHYYRGRGGRGRGRGRGNNRSNIDNQ